MADCGGVFPIEGPTGMAALWETPWLNDTLGVALMAIGWIILLRKLDFRGRLVLALSNASYGVYLTHMLILAPVSAWLRGILDSTPLVILLTAAITYTLATAAVALLRRIPRLGPLLLG